MIIVQKLFNLCTLVCPYFMEFSQSVVKLTLFSSHFPASYALQSTSKRLMMMLPLYVIDYMIYSMRLYFNYL
jgi:hypothetical protein